MIERARHRYCVVLLLALASAGVRVGEARTARVEIDRIETAALHAESVQIAVDWPDGQADATVSLDAAVLDAGESGYRFNDVRWRCELQQQVDGLSCEGELRARGRGRGKLGARWHDDVLELRFAADGGELSLSLSDAPLQIRALRLPTAWLQPLLGARWSEGRLTEGRIDADFALSAVGSPTGIAGTIAIAGLGLDSSNGRIAAAGLDARGTIEVRQGDDTTSVSTDLTLAGGELLAGAVYVELPESAVALGIALRSGTAGTWHLDRLHWEDAGALTLDGSAQLDIGADSPLTALDLEFAMPDLARTHPRYLESLLAGAGLANLAAAGQAKGRVQLQRGQLQLLEADLTQVSLRDAQQRFATAGLDGRMRWSGTDAALDGELRWASAQLYQIDLGPMQLPLRSQNGALELRQSAGVDLLGGRLEVSRFSWRSGSHADGDGALDMALSLRKLELASLSTALGWPAFGGSLSGEIPGVRYAEQQLRFEGGLEVGVFDGRVTLDELTLERPFGVAPMMQASIAFENLDLKPLTGAFGFGEISGRLQGHVRGLRLIDWEPVAFDAQLRTSTTAKDPRRISQRAVQDLSSVGGAGVAAGLQSQVLRVFDTFGYARIGLSCRLANNVCRMGGLDSSGAGYTIVEGSGLPRITVIGHQGQVDWPILVARLKAATQGQSPIVE